MRRTVNYRKSNDPADSVKTSFLPSFDSFAPLIKGFRRQPRCSGADPQRSGADPQPCPLIYGGGAAGKTLFFLTIFFKPLKRVDCSWALHCSFPFGDLRLR